MAKPIMIAVIFVQLVLLVHAVITIEKLNGRLQECQTWFDNTEMRIEELKTTAQEMTNLCQQYLQDDSLLMDNGNDQSRQ